MQLSAIQFNDLREMNVGWASVVLFLLCGLLTIDWIKKANRKVLARGLEDLPTSSGWPVGRF